MPCIGCVIGVPFPRLLGEAGPPPASSFLLLETADFFLLESGFKLII